MQKTKKAAAKRFKLTASGKVKFKRACLRHNLGYRGRNQKRALVAGDYLEKGDAKHIYACLPFGSLK